MLIKFDKFINEKLGILDSILEISEIAYNELKTKEYFQLKTNYLEKEITIDFYIIKNLDSDGTFSKIDNDYYKIKLSELNKPTIIHELKHMDRYIRNNGSGYEFKQLKTSSIISNDLGFLFKNKKFKILMNDILYFISPDEFESHYNHIYEELKRLIKDNMTDLEKRKIISNYLNDESSYFLNKYIYLKKLDIKNLFKSEEHCNYFLNKLSNNVDIIYKNTSNFKFINWLKWLFNNKIDKNNINKMNKYINFQAEKNYKKFNRLYSLLIN